MGRPRRCVATAAILGTALATGIAGLVGSTPAAASPTASANASTSAPTSAPTSVPLALGRMFSVDLRGNGHGHGMSQYGAQGAAQQGLKYRQILAFYYPRTRVRTLAPATIRVLISHPGNAVTVAAQRGLHVSGMSQVLPTKGVSKYRFISGKRRGIALFALHSSGWRPVRWGLPARTAIRRPGPVRVYLGDGSSTAYRQTILAVRRTKSGDTGLLTINRLSMDNYAAGVVPREMPASWDKAALQAQAVAVRSYARYEANHNPGNPYDICDTSMCQVYGGAAHYAPNGTLEWTDDPAAIVGDSNQYLTYRGAAVLAQFSASNGGWTVSGGMPYLPAKQDPYDSSPAADDPYALYQVTVRSADVAAYFGLVKLTGITITKRDGHGAWGGRVVTAQVTGRTSSGASKTITTDGQNLQWAFGVGTDWLRLTPTSSLTGAVRADWCATSHQSTENAPVNEGRAGWLRAGCEPSDVAGSPGAIR